MTAYYLAFDVTSLEILDKLALLACQDYNLGNSKDWFGHFRGGLYGHYSRLTGADLHYYNLHEWTHELRPKFELTEYNLASFFFHADSAVECLVYALNALGNAIDASAFWDVSDPKALRKISPADIPNLPGYQKYFPHVQKEWCTQKRLLETLEEQHSASKHRKSIYIGGQARADAPPGFFEALGLTDNGQKAIFSPHHEIILMHDPKSLGRPVPHSRSGYETLEAFGPSFVSFMIAVSQFALKDAIGSVPLREKDFRR